jgi:hypothetical protein
MPPGPWMKHTPTSEQEVVVLFALLLQHLPMRLELDEVREQFPDCLAWRVDEDGTRSLVRIEFELYASSFRVHGHDPNGCDLIVCWEDDIPGFAVPRLPLRPIAEVVTPPIIAVPMRPKYEVTVWTEETYLAECPADLRPVHADFLAWAKGAGEVVFGKGTKLASWTFQIPLRTRQRCTLFGVHANGKVWPIWPQRLPAGLAAHYKDGLRLVPKFKEALELGKAWCEADIREPGVVPVLQSAVRSVISRAGLAPDVNSGPHRLDGSV